jgi:hypothetical protein
MRCDLVQFSPLLGQHTLKRRMRALHFVPEDWNTVMMLAFLIWWSKKVEKNQGT